MPNLPVGERRGVVALYSDDADADLRQQLAELVRARSACAMWAEDEADLAAIGSVAGAGPAYVARFVAALAKAGEERGLAPDLAARIALETVLGTARMAAASGEDMDASRGASPAPTARPKPGLAVLDADGALDRLIAETIEAAARRGARACRRTAAEAARRVAARQ